MEQWIRKFRGLEDHIDEALRNGADNAEMTHARIDAWQNEIKLNKEMSDAAMSDAKQHFHRALRSSRRMRTAHKRSCMMCSVKLQVPGAMVTAWLN